MPPKKNVDNFSAQSKSSERKLPRKRATKEKVNKPKLKKATKVPSSSRTNLSVPDDTKFTFKNDPQTAGAQRKIDLANEVALAQLTKPKPPEVGKETELKKSVVKIKKPENVPKKKRGRQQKSSLQLAEDSSEISIDNCKESFGVQINSVANIKEPKKRVIAKKTPLKRVIKKTSSEKNTTANNTNKRKADSTSKKLVQRKYVKRNKLSNNTDLDIQPEAESTLDKTTNVRKLRGKNNILNDVSTTNHQQAPFLHEEDKNKLHSQVDKLDPPCTTASPNFTKIDSRKTSTSECLSWTKDISSSSNTTCWTVCSNDIARINQKVPVIKLKAVKFEHKIRCENKTIQSDSSDSESDDSSSSSSDSSSTSSSSSSNTDLVDQSLNLSMSTISHSSAAKDAIWEYALKKLASNLEKIDIDALNWISYENQVIDENMNVIQKTINNLSILENQVLQDCKNIKKFLSSDDIDLNDKCQNDQEDAATAPVNYPDTSDDENFSSSQSKYVMFDQNCLNNDEDPPESQNYDDDSDDKTDKMKYVPYEQNYNNDDDDALSLFAESITGIESSRYSSANSVCANASDYEEYVPKPLVTREEVPKTHQYVPTKIIDDTPAHSKRLICEKQNADSTSIYRDTDNRTQSSAKNVNNEDQPVQKPTTVQTIMRPIPVVRPSAESNKLVLMDSKFKPSMAIKSAIFRGVCFFNLISTCKKINCIFPHVHLDLNEILCRLGKLSDRFFIQEYMLMRTWPILRRRYGMYYVAECIHRKLTRILVEMAIDYISKAKLDSVEDATAKIEVAEKTLLYLNDVDLSVCDDLLQYRFGHEVLLCDIFMKIIAESQNFSRFKAVFIKLTIFITGIGRKFQLDIANQILERVCILPAEDTLARAMLIVLMNTDVKILENSMIPQFEKQLSKLEPSLYENLCLMKENAAMKQSQSSSECVPQPQISQDIDMNMINSDREERYTSPDTTKLDKSNKTQKTTSPQTVQIIRPSVFNNFKQNLNASSPSDNMDQRQKFRSWPGKNRVNNGMLWRFQRPPVRPPHLAIKRQLDQRHVGFGTPPKFPRWPGPDFY